MVWLMLVAGLVLLIIGADLLVRGAARLAASFGVPALVVGLTVVAFGTSAPELAVSVKSAWSGQAELAIANVVGSNIFNILFILGLAALVAPLIVAKQLIRQDVPIMIAVSLVAVLMTMDGNVGKLEAGALVLGLLIYTGFLFFQGRKRGTDVAVGELIKAPRPPWHNLVLVVVGSFRLIDNWLATWAAYLVLGLLFTGLGLFLWAKRRPPQPA